jgi:hypothetical protein
MRNKAIITTILSTLIGAAFALPIPSLAETSVSSAPAEQKELIESGTVEVQAQQVRLIVGGAKGTGVLHFNGKDYKFKMSGASVGGVGVTKVDAVGTVYNLKDIKDFPGIYAGMGVGATAVEGAGASSWENKGVVIKMKSKTEGLALNFGINSVNIELVK